MGSYEAVGSIDTGTLCGGRGCLLQQWSNNNDDYDKEEKEDEENRKEAWVDKRGLKVQDTGKRELKIGL